MRTCYKVVGTRRNKKHYESFLGGQLPNDIRLEYRLNEVTRPKIKGSRIFVFTSIRAADNWAGNSSKILRCEAPSLKKQNSIVQYCGDRSGYQWRQLINEFWNDTCIEYNVDRDHENFYTCDELTPISEVR